MDTFESQQQALFTTWFEFVKSQLGEDVAGNLQNQITALDTKTDGFDSRTTTFSADGKTITEIELGRKQENRNRVHFRYGYHAKAL